MTDLETIWSYVLEILKSNHTDTVIKLWFSDLKMISMTPDEVVFTTPTNIKRDIITKQFSEELGGALFQIMGFKPEVIINSREGGEADLSRENIEKFKRIEKGEETDGSKVSIPENYKLEYTFDNFVVGSSNKFAHATALAVAEKDYDTVDTQNLYNPLFIYGPSGVGKTHLLYAITNDISKRYPTKKIIYVKGEEFTNQLIDAIQKKTTIQFREKYRRADVLLIDDIQFVAGRISTQEELFNTFNAIYEDYKQIILTSDRPPKEIKTLEERLQTRFMSGIMADVSLPDFDLRVAILKQKAKQSNLLLNSDILNFLAENVTSSIRQLEGVIKKLGAISLLEGGSLDLERVKNSVRDFVSTKENDGKRMDEIILAVSKKYDISRDDILSSKRNKEIAMARHICVYIARTMTTLSQSQIGKALNRDRTTVISSEGVVKEEIEKNSEFAMEVREIIRTINSGI
jgi:chromosomal replication initiator protein